MTKKDYETQSNALTQRFIEKGYKKKVLEGLKEKVRKVDKETLLEGRKKKEKNKKYGGGFPHRLQQTV